MIRIDLLLIAGRKFKFIHAALYPFHYWLLYW